MNDRVVPDLSPDTLNAFYCSVATKIVANIRPSRDALEFLGDTSVSNSCYFDPTDIAEIKETLNGFKKKNACGLDNLSANILLNLPDQALGALSLAINGSLEAGIFPSGLKTALVVPLHKGGDVDLESSFRPISLLSTLSKLLEKLVHMRLTSFLQKYNIIDKDQFGFQSSKNTGDAIFSFLERLYLGINDRSAAAAVFCDLSKAFDCVSHRILLLKLEHYGCRNNVLDWFRSYLSDRKQVVGVAGRTSAQMNIDVGVPQGSVLGPLLFLLYFNDITKLRINGSFTLFADDTSIFWHGHDVDSLHRVISDDLLVVKDWCDSNFLSFNTSKTCIMNFNCTLGDVFLGDQLIESKSCTKFLGIFLDQNLKFNTHVTNLINKLTRGCYAVRLTSRELGLPLSKSVYFALIESHLRYGLPFWGSCSQTLFTSVFLIQKRAVRCLSGVGSRESCRPLFRRHKILTLPCLFILESVCLVFKRRDAYRRDVLIYQTRNCHDIVLPLPTSALVQNSIIYNSKKMFNHLPVNIKSLNSYIPFRKRVKKLLLEHVYYTISEYFLENL